MDLNQKKMKIKSILVCVFLLSGFLVSAQKEGMSDERRREFDAQKVAFFTQELDLAPAEAAVFWPLYNEMRKKMRECERNMRRQEMEVNKNPNLTEAQAKEAIGKRLAAEEKIFDLKKEYYLKMIAVVPALKVWKLDGTESKFHRQLFEKLKKRPAPEHK